MKRIHYSIEAFFTLLAYVILRALPLPAASGFCGWIARKFGPCTQVHRVARENIRRVFPGIGEAELARMTNGMWDNLGRVFGEYPHLASAPIRRRIQSVNGIEHLADAKQTGRPLLFISGHLGNWELPPVVATMHNMPLHLLYRPANNPLVDKLVAAMRRPYARGLYAKGQNSARPVIKAMRAGEPVAMLVDQKTNDGLPIAFFGHDAMTVTAVAWFVEKYNALIIPCRCIRREKLLFDIMIEPPMEFALGTNSSHNTQHILQAVNARLESWIREYPEQWFWVHKRWPKTSL